MVPPLPGDALNPAATTPAEVDLVVDAESMFERGADGLPTGALVAPRSAAVGRRLHGRPDVADRALAGRARDRACRRPRTSGSSTTNAVEGVCVEPQTAPPDAINLAAAAGEEPDVADPGHADDAYRWRGAGATSEAIDRSVRDAIAYSGRL